MTGVLQIHIDQALQAVQERPGVALVIISSGAFLLGVAGGHWYAKHAARRKHTSLQQYVKANGYIESGSSTPQFAGTPRASAAGDIEDKLDYSMALLYRTDLPTGKGRFATLCAQATLGQFKKLWRAKSEDLKVWERSKAVKFCLQVDDEAMLLEIKQTANDAGLPTFIVKDVQNNQRVMSVMALGPAESSRIRQITQNLKLLL